MTGLTAAEFHARPGVVRVPYRGAHTSRPVTSTRSIHFGVVRSCPVSAGGRVADESYAPVWWTLASPDYHGIDIAAWTDTYE